MIINNNNNNVDIYEQYSIICHILHSNFVRQILYVKTA